MSRWLISTRPLRTGPDGRAQVSFTLPDNMTSYRVYAVTADRGSGFASPERSMVASKDFYLEPGLPELLQSRGPLQVPGGRLQ